MNDDRTIRVRFLAEIQNYQQGLKTMASSTAQFARDNTVLMEKTGRSMTRYLTLPLVGAGVAATKMAGDFETAFADLVGLADVPAEEIDRLRQNVLDLAGETAQSPQKLAEALYQAASAGLDAQGAMEAVDVAARGAAAGLGSAADIVSLVASAVASYGQANIDAATATDVLTATIREGRADPQELAGSLGRVLPIAAQLGITFGEVGGAVAYLSNIFGDTARTVTAFNQILLNLSAPGPAAQQALMDMGTSVEELQAAISDRGLLGALELLRTKGFAGNAQAMRDLFPDARSVTAALALMNDNSGQLADTLGKVEDSAGSLATALAERTGTDAFKAKQAIVDLQVSLIEVGQILLPLVADVLQFGSTLFKWFSALPDPVQKLIVAFGGLVAVTGPMILIAAHLATALETLGVTPRRSWRAGRIAAVAALSALACSPSRCWPWRAKASHIAADRSTTASREMNDLADDLSSQLDPEARVDGSSDRDRARARSTSRQDRRCSGRN